MSRIAVWLYCRLHPPLSLTEQNEILRTALGDILGMVDARHPACQRALRALNEVQARR